METVYKVTDSRTGWGSAITFKSYREAARFVKFLLDEGRSEVKVCKQKCDKEGAA